MSLIDAFTWTAVVLSAGGAVFVAVLALRRIQLARHERRSSGAESRLRPVALALVEGESTELGPATEFDHEVLAKLLARYGRRLHGTARAHIADFFERRGLIDVELARLRSRRAWRRATAAFALGDMASERAIPHLVDALGDRERDVRSAAARSLGRLAAVPAVEPLVYALSARRIPWAVGAQALLAIGPAALPALRDLESRAEAGVRAAAVELVGLLGDASDGVALRERLRDSSADVRARAAVALGRLGAAQAAADLRGALEDRIAFVRAAAAVALGMIGDRAAVGRLARTAREDWFEAAHAAAQALAAIDPRAVRHEAESGDGGPHLTEALDLLELRAA